MTNRPPADIATRVKAEIYAAADDAKYMAMSRTESGRFMDGLVKRKDIGGILESYIPKQQIRHYIKDGVLNRYTKDKAGEAYDIDLEETVHSICGVSVSETGRGDGTILYRSQAHADDGKYVVVATGTFLKWETALRKALCFIAASPFSKNAKSVQTLLVLYAQGKIIPPADKALLSAALSLCGASAHIVGE